jgi:hypothetical protein
MTDRRRFLALWRHPAAGPITAGLLGLALMSPHVLPLRALGTLSYDALDANLFLWDFWWTRDALSAGQNPYWTPLLSYPSGASLAFHTFPIVYNVLSLPFQSLVSGTTALVTAFNALVLAGSIATAVGVYTLAVRLTGHRGGALAAAAIFTGSTYRLINVARLHVVATEWLVWYVVCFVALMEAPSRLRAIGCGACLALCVYTSPEYALYAAGFSAFFLIGREPRLDRARAALARRHLVLAACGERGERERLRPKADRSVAARAIDDVVVVD